MRNDVTEAMKECCRQVERGLQVIAAGVHGYASHEKELYKLAYHTPRGKSEQIEVDKQIGTERLVNAITGRLVALGCGTLLTGACAGTRSRRSG